MALIEAELGSALYAAVKRKTNNTQKLRAADVRAKASRVAAGSPEVMVKITGFGKGADHVKAHLDYITRKGKLEMENDRGEIFTGKEAGSRYFCESFFGHPCPTSGKNYATANAFGGPSRPASLVAYPT
jgi:type IV secretory pathway VirD2 relaxase